MINYRGRSWDKIIITVFIAYAVIAALLFVGRFIVLPLAGNSNEQTYVATVTDKEVKNYNNSSKYLIFTKTNDGETRVFSVEDSLLRGRWNSSDVFGEIEVGKTYKFTTVGYRIEFLSEYENIIDAQEISSDSADARQDEWALAGFFYFFRFFINYWLHELTTWEKYSKIIKSKPNSRV